MPERPQADAAPREPAAARRGLRSDLAYGGLALGVILGGLAVTVLGLWMRRGHGDEAYVAAHAVGVILVALGVGLFVYRLLDARDVGAAFSLAGGAAGGGAAFGLVLWIEEAIWERVRPPAPAAPPAVSLVAMAAEIDDGGLAGASLDGAPAREVFDFSRYLLTLTDPEGDPRLVAPGDNGVLRVRDIPMRPETPRLKGEILPQLQLQVRDRPAEFRKRYGARFCLVPKTAASWSDAARIDLVCRLGGPCEPAYPDQAKAASCPETRQAAAPLLDLIAPPAWAEGARAGWITPGLDGACAANRKLGETFYRFDATAAAPAGAAAFSYALMVNGTPVYENALEPHQRRYPVTEGRAALAFALQNPDLSGRAGPGGGREKLELRLRFYDAARRPLGPAGGPPSEVASRYLFTALRAPPEQTEGGVVWRGAYVLGREKDGRQIFVYSGADALRMKARFDARGLVFDGPTQGLKGLTAVAIVRPPLGQSPPGLGLAFRRPDGRLRFTFTLEEARQVTAWLQTRAQADPELSRYGQPWFRRLRGDDAVAAEQAGCAAA